MTNARRSARTTTMRMVRRTAATAIVVLAAVACSSEVARPDDEGGREADDATEATVDEGGGPGGPEPDVRHDGSPRAFDPAARTMLVLDALELSGDDVFVRLRIANGSGESLDLGVRDTFYGPLGVMSDDLGNSYPARAVEPAGIAAWSVADLRLRLRGPLDPGATELTFLVETRRGPLTVGPVPAPRNEAVSWPLERRPTQFDDPIVGSREGRTIRVTGVVDRGSHVTVSVEVDGAPSPLDGVIGDAALTSAGGDEFVVVPPEPRSPVATEPIVLDLRFVGAPLAGAGPARLRLAGVDVEIPSLGGEPEATGSADRPSDPEIPLPASPRLPDLIDMWLTDEPLPPSGASSE